MKMKRLVNSLTLSGAFLIAVAGARGDVVYSGYLAGRTPMTITAAGEYTNPSRVFPFQGVNTTEATLEVSDNWDVHVRTSSEVQNTTISGGNLMEASATIEVSRVGQITGPAGPYPEFLVLTGHLTGVVQVGTNSFHDGYLSFGESSIGSLEDLFFPDEGVYIIDLSLSMTLAVDATGQFTVNYALHSESWGRVGLTFGDFASTLEVTALLLPNGQTPESQGWRISFNDGAASPNGAVAIPEPSSLAMLGIATASLAGWRGWRRGKAPSSR